MILIVGLEIGLRTFNGYYLNYISYDLNVLFTTLIDDFGIEWVHD